MLENKDFGEYLKNLREQRELSLRKVEMLTNVNYSHLSLIENGLRSVTPALLKTLARVYRVNYLDLYEKAGYIDLANYEKNKSKNTTIPLLGVVKAGYDLLAEENLLGYVDVDLKNPEEYFALKVKGDSMQPVLYEDDIVIVHQQPDIENGQVAVVLIGDEATIKKIMKYDDCIELVAYNSYYPPKKLKRGFIIMGRVVEAKIKKIFE